METKHLAHLSAESEFARKILAEGKTVVVEFTPGNGTLYVLVITPLFMGVGAIDGNSFLSSSQCVVAVPNFGTSYQFTLNGGLHGEYIGEKLFKGNRADGAVVAEFLNELSGWDDE